MSFLSFKIFHILIEFRARVGESSEGERSQKTKKERDKINACQEVGRFESDCIIDLVHYLRSYI